MSEWNKSHIKATFNKAGRWNITKLLYNFDDLLVKDDRRLQRAVYFHVIF
jgi:hypothetical protein